MLRSRTTRREEPLGVHIPDPIVDPVDGTEPEHEALLADSVGLALLVVLETLSPAERLAFVLHDMFAVPFDEIASILDRSPEATRQLASRARRRLQGERAIPDPDLDRQRDAVDAFLGAGTAQQIGVSEFHTYDGDLQAWDGRLGFPVWSLKPRRDSWARSERPRVGVKPLRSWGNRPPPPA